MPLTTLKVCSLWKSDKINPSDLWYTPEEVKAEVDKAIQRHIDNKW